MEGVYELFLTSKGLNSAMGTNLIKKACEYEKLAWRSIFLVTIPDYGVDEIVIQACKELGIWDIFLAKDWEGVNACDLPDVDAVYITEGNTFEVAEYLRRYQFDTYIKLQVRQGATYVGASAGAILASGSFREALHFDRNFVRMTDFTGLCLLPCNAGVSDVIIPHYSFAQLQNYKSHMSLDELSCYGTMHQVDNEEILILECQQKEDVVQLRRKKRIRLA